jgi:hypothetical protein
MERSAAARSKTGVFLLIILCFALAIGWYWSWRDQVVSAAPVLCLPQNLSIKMGASDGAAGTMYHHVVATNKTTQSCTITGYPTAFLLGSNGVILGQGAGATSIYAPTKIKLAPKASAYTAIGIPNLGNFDTGVCTAVSAELRLYIPSAETPLDVPFSAAHCPGFSATAFKAGE